MNDGHVDFSVIILTCNRVARCLDSVAHNADRLTGHVSEIIVVNNGTQPVDLPTTIAGSSCQILQMPRNLGAEARNAGIAVAKGKYIVFVDDDAYFPDDFAKCTWKMFNEHPDVAGISFRVEGNNGEEESCLLPSVFHGCACAFTKKWLDKVGGYPKGYGYYGEEYDLAFKIYAQGGRIILGQWAFLGARASRPPHLPHSRASRPFVRHIRDSSGRNKERIIRLLIRNNIYTWCRFLPLKMFKPLIHDTLQRYKRVARKEGAGRGYLTGCLQVPCSMLRGLLHRKAFDPQTVDNVLLIRHLREVLGQLSTPKKNVVICGIGKFPSIWRQELALRGFTVTGYADFNTCWQDQQLDGVPVFVPAQETIPEIAPDTLYFVGLASLADNLKWHRLFMGAGYTDILPEMEQFADGRVHDLPQLGPFGVFRA